MENGQANGAATVREKFRRFSNGASRMVGSPWAFLLSCVAIVVWACMGPIYRYSNTWQLVINTGTTIVTFLMVFLIQNTQNRDARAVHLKLDELIRAMKGARNNLVNLEEMTDEELDTLQEQFQKVCGSRKSGKEDAAKREQKHSAVNGAAAAK
jgi:low affinity Fe/Cu permease